MSIKDSDIWENDTVEINISCGDQVETFSGHVTLIVTATRDGDTVQCASKICGKWDSRNMQSLFYDIGRTIAGMVAQDGQNMEHVESFIDGFEAELKKMVTDNLYDALAGAVLHNVFTDLKEEMENDKDQKDCADDPGRGSGSGSDTDGQRDR